MIPHYQTLSNDCFRTCVESILELPLATAPNFCSWDAKTWFQSTTIWLTHNTQASDLLRVVVTPDEKMYQSGLDLIAGIGIKDTHSHQECLVIEDVMTPRGLKHSIISRISLSPGHFDIEKIHDPHPDGGETWPENEWHSFYAIVGGGLWH